MEIRLKLFGALREAVAGELLLELPEGTRVAELRSRLAREHEVVAALGSRVRVARNFEFVDDDAALADGDEVAVLPPVSGGGGRCSLSESPLEVGDVVRRVAGPDTGGIVTFVGTVRDTSRGRDILHLTYEAYAVMAEQEMERIADEASERWPGARVAVAHRTGQLGLEDIAVVVVAAAPHRPEAFAACRYTIDTLKERVPIWKKEVATDGETWVDDHA